MTRVRRLLDDTVVATCSSGPPDDSEGFVKEFGVAALGGKPATGTIEGATARQAFRHVLAPNLATVRLAGGMLAVALSFDEIIVTLVTAGHGPTLPISFFNELFRPRNRPVTNVVAIAVVAVKLIPILLADRLTRARDS